MMSRVKPGYLTDFNAFFTCSSEIDISATYARRTRGKPCAGVQQGKVDRLLLKMPVRLGPMVEETSKPPGPQFFLPTRSTKVAIKLIGPGNPSYSESDIRSRQNGEKAALPLLLQNPGFASRTRRGISSSLDSPAA